MVQQRFLFLICGHRRKSAAKAFVPRSRRSPDVPITRFLVNIPRYPMVLKDDAFPANFAQVSRYNEQALVYSGLLALNAAFASFFAS
jgi:hypothetical protein